MSKKKAPRIDEPGTVGGEEQEEAITSTAAAMLSAEYPLIDISLILAIVSDYNPFQLESELPAIRDQLGILEATIVPDPDETPLAENGRSSLAESVGEVASGMDQLGVREQDRAPGTYGQEAAVAGPSNPWKLNSSTTDSSSDGMGNTTSGTSDLGEPEWQSEVEMLKALFPAISEEEIREVHAYEPSVSATIDHLLNLDMLRNVQENGHWPGEERNSEGEQWEEVKKTRSGSAPMSRSGSGSSVSSGSSSSVLMPPRTQSTAKRKKKDTLTIPLVDTLQRRASPSQRSSRQTSRGTSPNRYSALSGPSTNAWDTMSSLAAALSDLLPYPPKYFLTYFHSPDYRHPYEALRAALAGIPSKHDEIDVGAEQILQDIYLPDPELDEKVRATRADLEICGGAAGSDVATVMDLMDLLAEVSTWAGDEDAFDRTEDYVPPVRSPVAPSPSVMSPPPIAAPAPYRGRIEPKRKIKPKETIIPGSKPAPSSASNPKAHDDFGVPSPAPPSPAPQSVSKPQIHPQNFHKVERTRNRPSRALHPYASHIPSYARGVTPHDSTPGSLYRSVENGYTIEECMNRAAAERAKQQSAIRDVGKHWSGHLAGGKFVGGAVAGHYALEARNRGDRAREWELKAARMVVDSQLSFSGDRIDLHHMTIAEATTVAAEAAERWFAAQKQSFTGHAALARDRQATYTPAKSLNIITGVGHHSAGKRGVLKPAVASALEEAGWRVERGPTSRGYLIVKGRR